MIITNWMKAVIAVVVIVGLVTFARVSLAHWNDNAQQLAKNASATSNSGVKKVAAVTKKVLSDQVGTTTLTGMVVFDSSNPSAPVPYIAFMDAQGHYATKQLIYSGPRGCDPTAADLPCAPPRELTDAYPALTAGEHIQVTGTFEDTRFLVQSLSKIPS